MGSEFNSAELEVLESKFNAFLNLTIAGASRDYYKKERIYYGREIAILDDYGLDERIRSRIEKEASKMDAYDELGPFSEDFKLNIAFESLSDVEQTVIFLYFKKKYRSSEIAKMLNITVQSVSRIKKRALNRIKVFIEGMRDYE